MGTQPKVGFERVEPRKQRGFGEPPVPDPPLPEPTDEQLENCAFLLGLPMLASPIIKQLPWWRESMLNLHKLLQRAVNGDAEAAARLALFKELGVTRIKERPLDA